MDDLLQYIEAVNVTVTVTIVIVVQLGSGEAQKVKRSLDGYILAQKRAAQLRRVKLS